MTQFITDLTTFLANHSDINEYFRASMEQALNELLQAELTSVLGYEPYDVSGYNSGNSRNGSYTRKFETKYGIFICILIFNKYFYKLFINFFIILRVYFSVRIVVSKR